MNKFGFIIEARTKSTRLPNKILLKLGKETVLGYLINRLKPISKKYNAKIVVATTIDKSDIKIIRALKNKKEELMKCCNVVVISCLGSRRHIFGHHRLRNTIF